jgi:hypothetical protein
MFIMKKYAQFLPLVMLFCLILAGSVSQAAAAVSVPAVLRAGQPFSLNYPRLGMWWPSSWTQPVEDMARYDWVIYGPWANMEALAKVKAINPNQVFLNSTNACEVSFDPDEASNPEVEGLPAEWFLTQVGTTLKSPVNATTETFYVDKLTVSDGQRNIPLFVAGDTALIEGESVYIKAVNTSNQSLSVRRGYIRPASAHSAGTRLAAHVTFWPGSWVMNVSTLSPKGMKPGNSSVPERWADYNARIAIGLVQDPAWPWDGLLIDRSDDNESWLIGNSTARTIDPTQSNTLLTDYSGFDAAWNEGIRQYEGLVRAGIGEDRIIFSNWGMPNYDLLNGNNFEDFPGEDTSAYGTQWNQAVFGPWEKGSYFEWMSKSRQPNLTMIETYEDDGGPSPTGNGAYDNPCAKAGFVPNYRKMRFGLATALLNDGFFSYEMNTNGHGSLCLMWFDEYDNAGQGKGYLGQPLGPAYQAVSALSSPDLVVNGGLNSQAELDQWNLWADQDNGYQASVALDSVEHAAGAGSARIEISQTQGVDWRVSFSREPLPLLKDQDYTLSFWAKADRQRTINTFLQQAQSPWSTWLDLGKVNLTTSWQRYELSGSSSGTDTKAVLQMALGEAPGQVWIDEVKLQAGSRNIWRRDYEGGTVLLNASNHTQAVQLEKYYLKIRGRQAPQINNGQPVNAVTLPVHDALILLRFTPGPMIPRLFLPLSP